MTSSIYNYQNNAKLWLPMTAACHDPGNVRTLDKSGNNLNATFGNGATPATYPTKLGSRGYSDDGGDYLNVGDQAALNFGATGSVCVLLKAGVNATNYQFIVGKQNWTTGNNGYSMWLNITNALPRMDIRGGGLTNVVSLTTPISNRLVHFLAMVWNGTLLTGYVDDEIVSTAQTTNPAYAVARPFTIFADSQTLAYNTTGNIYFVGAWDYALTLLQIRDLEARLRRQLNDV